MAFGQDTNNIAPAMKEKVQPSASAMKLAYKPKKKALPESKETPQMEASNHSAPYLKKALSYKKK